MWPYNLSVRLPVSGLVGRYPPNYLIGHKPLHRRPLELSPLGLRGISNGFPSLFPSYGQVLVLYSPVRH